MPAFELPKLTYAYGALEPYIDAATMELHLTKHHNTYVTKLNEALVDYPDLQEMTLEKLLSKLEAVPAEIRTKVRNHGGGHHNHSLFWKIMAPPGGQAGVTGAIGGGEPSGELKREIEKAFESFAGFKDRFSKAAKELFGSGWTWLVIDPVQALAVVTTANQDSPIMSGFKPIIGLDVWEHAYYLKYQNKRPDYVDAWWNVVNWAEAENNFLKAQI